MKLRQLARLTIIEAILFLREPFALFFTLVFPLAGLLIFGAAFGKYPSGIEGFRVVDVEVPIMIATVVAIVGLMSVPIALAENREQGTLRRLRATPLRPSMIIGAQLLVNYLMLLMASFIVVIFGRLIYNTRFGGSPVAFLLLLTLSAAAFIAFGFALASVAKTARLVQALSMFLFFPMLFLSGAAIPLSELPKSLQAVAPYIPLTHVVNTMIQAWTGPPNLIDKTSLAVLIGIFIVSTVVAVQIFRWD